MYESFYGLREPPFRVTPDPRFLYRNPTVDEALAALSYGIEQRKGFLSLVGEVGTGKTTLLRHLLGAVSASTQSVLLLYPTVQFDEMLVYILQELGIPTAGAGKLAMLQRLHEFLLEHTRSGGNAAILIDEAQDLDARALEEFRLLSNLETGTEKILQIVLAGQPELERKLAQPELRQLRQRIALHVRLRVLAPVEVAAYVRTRLERAGAADGGVFAPDALARVAEVTGGIPRLVNVLCDACLVTGFVLGSRQITRPIVDEAWADYARLAPPSEETLTEPPAPAPAPAPAAADAPAPVVVAPEPQAAPVEADAAAEEPEPGAPPPASTGRRTLRIVAWVVASAATLAAASALWAMAPQLLALVR